MTESLSFASIPNVLDDEAIEFVLGFTPDARPSLEVGGAAYRRGTNRYVIEWPMQSLRLRAAVATHSNGCYVSASAGPLLNEWWPLLRTHPGDPARPLLSAGAVQRSVTMREPEQELSLPVTVTPGNDDIPVTMAVAAFRGGLTEENMLLAHMVSLGVIKAALLTLVEYRTLVGSMPAINVSTEGSSILLSTLLEIAEAAGSAISWIPSKT